MKRHSRDRSSSSRAPPEPHTDVDEVDALPPDNRLPQRLYATDHFPEGRLNVYSRPDYLSFVYNKLKGTEEWKDIKASQFGNLFSLTVSKMPISCRLIHALLARQLVTEKQYELWTVYGGHPIRFSLQEFSTITGLHCSEFPSSSEPPNVGDIVSSSGTPWEKYIGLDQSASLSDIAALLESSGDMPGWRRLGLALLLIIDGVLIANHQGNGKPTPEYVAMLAHPKAFLQYPWGRESFAKTIGGMLPGRPIQGCKLDPITKFRKHMQQVTYSLKGFPLALQLLAFRRIPALEFHLPHFQDKRTIQEIPFITRPKKVTIQYNDCLRVEFAEKVEVLPFNSADDETHLLPIGWKDEVEDTSVSYLEDLIKAGHVFTKQQWPGGDDSQPQNLPPTERSIVGKRKGKEPAIENKHKLLSKTTTKGNSGRKQQRCERFTIAGTVNDEALNTLMMTKISELNTQWEVKHEKAQKYFKRKLAKMSARLKLVENPTKPKKTTTLHKFGSSFPIKFKKQQSASSKRPTIQLHQTTPPQTPRSPERESSNFSEWLSIPQEGIFPGNSTEVGQPVNEKDSDCVGQPSSPIQATEGQPHLPGEGTEGIIPGTSAKDGQSLNDKDPESNGQPSAPIQSTEGQSYRTGEGTVIYSQEQPSLSAQTVQPDIETEGSGIPSEQQQQLQLQPTLPKDILMEEHASLLVEPGQPEIETEGSEIASDNQGHMQQSFTLPEENSQTAVTMEAPENLPEDPLQSDFNHEGTVIANQIHFAPVSSPKIAAQDDHEDSAKEHASFPEVNSKTAIQAEVDGMADHCNAEVAPPNLIEMQGHDNSDVEIGRNDNRVEVNGNFAEGICKSGRRVEVTEMANQEKDNQLPYPKISKTVPAHKMVNQQNAKVVSTKGLISSKNTVQPSVQSALEVQHTTDLEKEDNVPLSVLKKNLTKASKRKRNKTKLGFQTDKKTNEAVGNKVISIEDTKVGETDLHTTTEQASPDIEHEEDDYSYVEDPSDKILVMTPMIASAKTRTEADVVPAKLDHLEEMLINIFLRIAPRFSNDIFPQFDSATYDILNITLENSKDKKHVTKNDFCIRNQLLLDFATPTNSVNTLHMEVLMFMLGNHHAKVLSKERSRFVSPIFINYIIQQRRAFGAAYNKKRMFWSEGLQKLATNEDGKWLEDVDTVYVPMVWGKKHWVGLAINFKMSTIEVMDPHTNLFKDNRVQANLELIAVSIPFILRSCCKSIHTAKLHIAPFKVTRTEGLYHNNRSGDCGPLCVKFMECHALGIGPETMNNFTDKDVDIMRKQYVIDMFAYYIVPLFLDDYGPTSHVA